MIQTNAEPLVLIPLSIGGRHGDGRMKYALIDAADYPKIAAQKWSAWTRNGRDFYAQTSPTRGKTVQLSRQILGLDAAETHQADHANHITLDNRRANLRQATLEQNRRNARLRSDNRARLKGVHVHSSQRFPRRPFQAVIYANGAPRNLGYFATAKEAADAYDRAAREVFGDFAMTNGH